jgi:hypothetical protein
MGFEKKAMGAVCAICGAALLWNCVHPNVECRREQLCEQPALHQDDVPQRKPAPVRTTGFVEHVTSASATSALGPLFYVVKKQT